MRLKKDPTDVYAKVFDNVIEVGGQEGRSTAIPWRAAERTDCSPDKLAEMLNKAYRAGQLNLWTNMKVYLGMK